MIYWRRKGEDFEKMETIGDKLNKTIIKKEDVFLNTLSRTSFYDNSIHELKEEIKVLKQELKKVNEILEHFNLKIIEEDDY
jgi:hypothetical protein